MNRSNLLAGCAFACLSAAAMPAFAQDAASDQVGEVVVTARARSESIQNVPAQVTAFTAAAIDAKGITNPADFLDSVPNVSFIATQNAGTSFIVIRGISQARNSEPSVSVVVDGVPMTQPAQLNQELLDIQQIEVLKGPQGALYGRNAIGGAILITTKQATDEWQGRLTAGYEGVGQGGYFRGVLSGPITDTLKVRIATSYMDHQGHLRNNDRVDKSAGEFADPLKNFSGRVSFNWTPDSKFSADLRLSTDLLNTRGLYYVVPPFGSPNFNDPDYTDQRISLNNSGKDNRKIYDVALKMNYAIEAGTFTSISGYSTVWEALTGDGYPFAPFGRTQTNFDYSQSQFLSAKTFTQELRYTSRADRRFRYIVGGQIYSTRRFIATGNMYDVRDEGVQPVYRTPNPQVFAPHGQLSYLSDSQRQTAWAGYIDTTTALTDKLELSANLRYDKDRRTNTTMTPQSFLTAAGIPGRTGDKRKNTWDSWQPQAVLRYQLTPDASLYASYSRGFRSGGFNQTGVATAARAAGFDNVGDQFSPEIADTVEAGFKTRLWNNRVQFNGSVFTTGDKGAYYFVFLAANSTQNLGSIEKVRLTGFDLDLTARLAKGLTANVGFGYVDSEIKRFAGASSPLVIGSKAPLVSDYTANIGLQYTHALWNGWDATIRADNNLIGPTAFVIPVPAAGEPAVKRRNPVNVFDLRVSVQNDDWQLTAWSKNLFDKKYNAEYSTGGFLFRAQPLTWGLDLTRRF
jgi:iron complex outermembrane receptor protein